MKEFWIVGVGLVLFFSQFLILRSTTFQGEHWELMQDFLGQPSLEGRLAAVSQFNCFGFSRQQPLAFFLPFISYTAFGLNIQLHLLFSAALHLITAYLFARLYLWSARRPRDWSWWKGQLAFVAFLLNFAAADLLSWTFFQYVQCSTLIGVAAVILYLENFEAWNPPKILAICLMILDILIYECYIVVPLTFLIAQIINHMAFRKRNLPELSVLSFCSLVMILRLQHGANPHLDIHNPFALPLSSKLIPYLLCSTALFFANFLFNSLWFFPATLWGGVHFSMELLPRSLWESMILYTACFLGGLMTWTAYRFARERQALRELSAFESFASAMCLLVGAGLYAAIAYGRRDHGIYSVFQFRYAYTALPFLAIPVFHALDFLLANWPWRIRHPDLIWGLLLSWSALTGFANTSTHHLAVAKKLEPLSVEFTELRQMHIPDVEVVARIVQARRQRTLSGVSSDSAAFVYNGTKCHSNK